MNSSICLKFISGLNGAFFPDSWEDINSEINFSQMLHSARIYQLPPTNGLCCIQTTHTLTKNYIGNVIIQKLPALKEKQVSSITFVPGCKLTNQS